ncbi:MAG: transcriptional regulator [Streptococcus dysgalactiae]|nr:transcriptional regulator [Streptococcus dysgalactiae]
MPIYKKVTGLPVLRSGLLPAVLVVFHYFFQEKRLRVPTERLALHEKYSFLSRGIRQEYLKWLSAIPNSFLVSHLT